MAKGISIHVGVNHVDEKHYKRRLELPNCANDAAVMGQIAQQNGFICYRLIDEEATALNFFYLLNMAADELRPGDILFVSFSGHGSYVKDVNGDEPSGGQDQTIFLYDRMVIDDELGLQWRRFRSGVRVLFISDSCYSGSIIKNPDPAHNLAHEQAGASKEAYLGNQEEYDSVLKNIPSKLSPIQCSLMLLSACQDDQPALARGSYDAELSIFTEVLVSCWDKGFFEGDYCSFYQEITKKMKARKVMQRPNYCMAGKRTKEFESQRPFSI